MRIAPFKQSRKTFNSFEGKDEEMSRIRVSAFRWVPRARAKSWMFAARNTVEPAIQQLAEIDLFHAGEEWAKQRRPAAVEADRFTAVRHTQLVAEQPVLEAYHVRCAARPAYQKAMAAHLAPFARNAPPGQ
jgi:glutathione S-transferase